MAEFLMIAGFLMAAYSIVANDSIQTLGTFLSSNAKRPWWVLWIWISGLMVLTITWGWMVNGGDPAFGRLSADGKNVPHPFDIGGTITWLFLLPPLALVILTRMGIPVSTSLLVLTAFQGLVAHQQGKSAKGALDLFSGMMQKSLVGYAIAFAVGIVIFALVLFAFERTVKKENDASETGNAPSIGKGWVLFQWLSTGFLWSMWLVQDLANIFVYVPRILPFWGIALALASMVLMQGYIIREKGGKIQKVVTSKTNTLDIRSATFVDLFYGLVLLFFKVDYIPKLFMAMGMDVPWPEKMPMSTTWVFLGLLAGREIGIAIRLRHRSKKKVSNLIFTDAGKAFAGSVIAVILAMLLPILAGAPPQSEDAEPVEAVEETLSE